MKVWHLELWVRTWSEHQTNHSADSDTDADNTKKPPSKSVTLPYVRGLSETIKRLLEKLHVDVRVRFRPKRTLRQMLVKPKDHVPLDQQNGVVYRIHCRDCEITCRTVRLCPLMQREGIPKSNERRIYKCICYRRTWMGTTAPDWLGGCSSSLCFHSPDEDTWSSVEMG